MIEACVFLRYLFLCINVHTHIINYSRIWREIDLCVHIEY